MAITLDDATVERLKRLVERADDLSYYAQLLEEEVAATDEPTAFQEDSLKEAIEDDYHMAWVVVALVMAIVKGQPILDEYPYEKELLTKGKEEEA